MTRGWMWTRGWGLAVVGQAGETTEEDWDSCNRTKGKKRRVEGMLEGSRI